LGVQDALAKTLFGALLRLGIAMGRSEFAKKYFENRLNGFALGSPDRLLLVHNFSRNFSGNSRIRRRPDY